MIIKNISSLEDAINYYQQIIELMDESIIIDFKNSEFIRNNYLSLLGLALKQKKDENKKIKIILPDVVKVAKSLESSGFLEHFIIDKNSTTIVDSTSSVVKYTNIQLNDWDSLTEFYLYFESQLNQRVKNLSPELSNKIIQKIFELFSNVFRHSQSKFGFFCSGQIYDNKFYFTIVDGGVTIPSNINGYLKRIYNQNKGFLNILRRYKPLSGIRSIKWAMIEKNSTTGEGGLGLNLLQELILKSKGALDIISNTGHYSIKDGKESNNELNYKFDGTIISIGLSISEDTYYFLKDGK